MKVKFAVPVPLTWCAPNIAATKVVKAQLYNGAGTPVGSLIILPHLAGGLYTGTGPAMPGTLYSRVLYQIFEADGTTPSVDTEQRRAEVVELDTQNFITALTGFLDNHMALPIRDTVLIVRGEAKTIPITLMQSKDNFAPLDISAATEIVCRFINQDQTLLLKKLSLNDVQIIAGQAGQLTVSLSAADTTLLRMSERQNMQVDVTIGGLIRSVPIFGKLNVLDTVTI